MSNIKKHVNDSWKVLASGQATGISVKNTKLLEEGEELTSVDAVLEKHEDDINKLYRNVAWLALNGGGGSGGGSGSGGGISEAFCTISVNGMDSGSEVVMDKSGLQISLNNINVALRKNWTVNVRIGSLQVATAQASFVDNTIFVDTSKISGFLTNHKGNLYINATYEDEGNGIYGAAKWEGSLIESIVNISTTNEAFTLEDINTAQIIYKYSVGVVGEYTLGLEAYKDGELYKAESYDLVINSTSQQSKAIQVSDFLDITHESDELTVAGVYNISAVLRYNDNSAIQGTFESTITIVSDNILLSTTKLSSNKEKPMEVNMSGSIQVNYTSYLQGYKTFMYTYEVGILDKNGNETGRETIKTSAIGYFGEQINDYVSVYNKSWVNLDHVVPLYINIDANDKKSTFKFYLKFVASSNNFLSFTEGAQTQIISEFLSRSYNTGDDQFNLEKEGYLNGGKYHTISSKITPINGNYLSCINTDSNGVPYLRLSNSAFAKLDGWKFNNKSYTLSNLLNITSEFTISLCFKADYHPDDYRTILCCGNIDANTGEVVKGISIDVHNVYINGVSKVTLTDNVINMVDITCTSTQVYDPQVGKEVRKFLVKVYLDGVLTAISEETQFLSLGDCIYLGGKQYNSPNGMVYDYLCDCNIYNLQIFDAPLSDLDIMTNYINNKVATSYINKQPNFNIIDSELKKNFCERNPDGSVVSKLFQNGQYSINFLLDASDKLSEEYLNSYAKILGIPIMLIDVHEDSAWTFNAFVTQQTAGTVSLNKTERRTIQYWDPTGGNTKVVNIKDCDIELQGTSTLSDAVKNINITTPNTTAFAPKASWLPEQVYTLKADVVDSSHSNNAAVGSFINKEFGVEAGEFYPFDENARNNVYKSDYVKNQQPTATLKHTVEGFPVLLIMKFSQQTAADTVSVTPLGIYSFNLGRDAHRNLGFKKVNSITAADGSKPVLSAFPYLLEDATFNETESDANWIEIKDTTSIADLVNFEGDQLPANFNASKGDFWQNDDSILNSRYEVRYGTKLPAEYSNFKNFVSNIMALPIEGTYSTLSALVEGENVVIPQVTGPAYDLYKVDSSNNYIKLDSQQAFVTDINTLPEDLGYNEESLYKYFVTALLFGLIDNFGKNSTYRSWNNGQYYIDFYDLDCALGGGNQGQLDISPDCWIKYLKNDAPAGGYGYVCETYDKDKGQSGTVVSANHNKLWMSLDTTFYRSYRRDSYGTVKSIYTKYWYELRTKLQQIAEKAGYDNFVDYFIEEYYIKQTGECGPLLFNYDYKLKYLLQFTGDTFVSSKDLTKLHGRKIAYARAWLKEHILFLDSVFHWRDNSQTMLFRNNFNNKGASTVYNTPAKFPIKTNTSLILSHSVGNTTDTMYFLPKNTEVFVNAGSNSSNSALTWNISNSSNVIGLGNDNIKMSEMNVNIINFAQNSNNWDILGFPALTDLNLSGNTSFGSGFNLDAFEQGALSELRTIDFSKTSGNSFSLDLTKTTTSGEVFTKYKKLTKVDISESTCVSNLIIPEIPLKELSVYKSSITEFKLRNQKYLSNVDLTDCTKLDNIRIESCDAYTSFNITNLTNLKSITLLNNPNIKSISITNCPNLKTVNIENCSSVTSITITGCNSLAGDSSSNYVTIAGCTSLQSLNLSNNSNLQTITLANSNQSKINTFNIRNTKISYISGDDVDVSLLDLSTMSSLTSFSCTINSSVNKIQFANNYGAPIPLTSSFYGCNNLERIYGNVRLQYASYSNYAGMFQSCSKFSLHGTSATTWNGKNIKDGSRIKTPWEIVTGFRDGTNYDNVTLVDLFQSGKGVTNICFNNSSNVLYYAFEGTNLTQFDVYYALCAFALSGVTVGQDISRAFWVRSGMFVWANNCHMDRYMFYKCSPITSIYNAFRTSDVTLLLSPEDGKDNGVFSPLVNLTSFTWPFNSSVVFSRKLFHRNDGKKYKITALNGWTVPNVFDSDSDFLTRSAYNNRGSNLKKLGDFTDFFKDLPSINSVYSIWNGIEYLNLDTLKFPTSIATVALAFNPTYSTGTLDLEQMFPENSQCVNLCRCFIINGTNSNYGPKSTMPIRSTTFSHLKNIVNVGYDYGNIAEYGTADNTSFRGGGLSKFIDDSEFPENIVANCSKLRTFGGFFREVASKTFSSTPKIPGNMFVNNKNLVAVGGLMMNTYFQYELSGEGFKNCTGLTDAMYMCYHEISSTSRSTLIGEIPYKFFYHGHSTGSATYKGVDQESKPDSSVDVTKLSSKTVTFNSYNKNLTHVRYCFHGCTGLEAYTNKANSKFVENNSNYKPFKWIYDEKAESWTERDDNYELDASWGYNGDPSTRNTSYKYLESGDVSLIKSNTIHGETINYMCAPDILRYCKNSNATTVYGLFARCGLDFSASSGGDIGGAESMHSAGITGRIVPYLLQPVSNVTSVYQMFRFCRMLSSYKDSAGNIYQIPPDFFTYAKKVTDIKGAFEGLSLIYGTRLDIFSPLTGNLDARCVYACINYGSNAGGGTHTYSGIFATNSMSHISGAFSTYDLLFDSSVLGVNKDQSWDGRVTGPFDHIKFTNNFNASKIPSSTNIGFVYYRWGTGRVTDTAIANKNSNY